MAYTFRHYRKLVPIKGGLFSAEIAFDREGAKRTRSGVLGAKPGRWKTIYRNARPSEMAMECAELETTGWHQMTPCPKCSGLTPPYGMPGASLSREDGKTVICSNCGTQQALADWAAAQTPKLGHDDCGGECEPRDDDGGKLNTVR